MRFVCSRGAWRAARRALICSCLAVLVSLQSPAMAQMTSAAAERTAWLMGTELTIRSMGPSETDGFRAIEAAFDSVRAYEALLSTWRDDTPLSRLNTAPVGEWVPVPPALGALLDEFTHWSTETSGAFDPGLGALIDAWDLRGHGRYPSDAELSRALAATGLRHFEVAPNRRRARRLVDGAWIDAGAFGKGVALDAAARGLRAGGAHAALLNFGGQVVGLAGSDPRPWRVPVAHPHDRQTPVATLALAGHSAATSGQSQRGITVDGRRMGHLLDPRTGTPVPPWGSVTVVHPKPIAADVLATALFVLGPEAGMAWAEDRGIAALFLIVQSGSGDRTVPAARCTRAMTPLLEAPASCG